MAIRAGLGIPDNVDLWLALARLESYEKARKVHATFQVVS